MRDDDNLSAFDNMSESSEGAFDKLPASLQALFKDMGSVVDSQADMLAQEIAANGKQGTGASLFTKSRVVQVNSDNALDEKHRRAEEIFQRHKLFGAPKTDNAERLQG